MCLEGAQYQTIFKYFTSIQVVINSRATMSSNFFGGKESGDSPSVNTVHGLVTDIGIYKMQPVQVQKVQKDAVLLDKSNMMEMKLVVCLQI